MPGQGGDLENRAKTARVGMKINLSLCVKVGG